MGMLMSCGIDGQCEVGIAVLGGHDRFSPWMAFGLGFGQSGLVRLLSGKLESPFSGWVFF